ncbi:MAG TPA: RICIN domain-containing protein [Polyangiaceae bacterium]|nr:RICIN domain-containing protein [Polyangiaceae bacterium]
MRLARSVLCGSCWALCLAACGGGESAAPVGSSSNGGNSTVATAGGPSVAADGGSGGGLSNPSTAGHSGSSVTSGGAGNGNANGGSATAGSSSNGGAGTMGNGGTPATGGTVASGGTPPASSSEPLVNGIQWADTTGKPIQAHGGGMIKVADYYYWFGENRNPNGSFYAVSSYRSRDLRSWEFRNHVLRSSSHAELNPANIERPKVVYNAATGKYVMWMHWENGSNYGEARAAVATASSVDGDYTYQGSFRPLVDSGVTDHDKPGYMSRDCGLFVDEDQKAYFISATNENSDLNLYLLTPDYLKIDKLAAVLLKGGHREAPVLFKRNGTYFLLTSGATGWNPNQASYATSSSLTSGWSSQKNVGDGNTFYSQSTYVLPIQSGTGSSPSSYLYMGDRWAGAWGGRVNDSSYIWLPITFSSATAMSLSWSNALSLDGVAATLSGATRNFQFVNAKSGKALEVQGASSTDGASIVQNPASNATSQQWGLEYDGAGYFNLSNVASSKVLDVPDESTADGIELKQWKSTGGDNQAWLLIDLGGGLFQIRNKHSNKFVGVVDAATSDGAAIEQRAASTGDEQRWRLVIAK